MNLAQLIHKALTNPQYRLALETGSMQVVPGLSTDELELAAAILRANIKGTVTGVFNQVNKDGCVWQ